MGMMDDALRYAALGWKVFPCHTPRTDMPGVACSCEPGRRRKNPNYQCHSPGKHPRTANGLDDASSDPEQIREWWKQWPDANIGINCGASGLLVVDLDEYKDNYQGHDLELDDADTVTAITGGGGGHGFYRLEPGDTFGNSSKGLPPGIDIRGIGGYVVVAPSLHKSGNIYQWEHDYSPWEMEPAPIPPKLRALLEAQRIQKVEEVIYDTSPKYNGTGASRYGAAALKAQCEAVATTGEGGRNEALNVAAFSIGQLVAGGEISLETATTNLIAAAIDAGLSQLEAQRTTDSGIKAGMLHPRSSTPVENVDDEVDAAFRIMECPDAKLIQRERKTMIQVNDRQLEAIILDAIDAIRLRNSENTRFPAVYVRGGALATIATDEDGVSSPSVLSVAGARGILCQVADWVKVDTVKGEERIVNVPPPKDAPSTLLSWPGGWPDIPPLEGVVSIPVFSMDGRLHDEPGYDHATKLFYPGGVQVGDTQPTRENVAKAMSLIDELLFDFPFKKDAGEESASRAHAIAMIILPFVRPMIAGPTPLHLIDSPTPGTGKGLLAMACAYPALGHAVASVTAGKDEDEWRKRITSFLRDDGEFILIDNISTALDSGSLASALTQPIWKDRILGHSENARIKIRSTWAATGNNVPTSKEIARRTVWIRIDASLEKPWERTTFKHADLLQWTKRNRNELVTAVITLVRNWLEKGQKPFTGRPKGSYPEWTAIIGGILEANGIPGFLGNEDDLHKLVSSEGEVLRDFVAEWARLFGDRKKGVGDLFELASYPDDPTVPGAWSGLLDALLGSGKQRSRQIKFGQLLNAYRDGVFSVGEGENEATYKINFEGISGGEKQYSLKPVGSEDGLKAIGL